MQHSALKSLRVHPDTLHSNLADALENLKSASPPQQSWRQATNGSEPASLMKVIPIDTTGKSDSAITLESTRLRASMNRLGFGGADYDINLNPGVQLDTIAHILNTQTIIRRGQVSEQKPGDWTGLVASFSDPNRQKLPAIQERMGISPKGGIPLEGIEACLTLLGVNYTIAEDESTAPHALITDNDSIIKVLQCTEYTHYQQPHASAAETSSGRNKPSPPLGEGFRLGHHSL
jgi:hypothetical protein